MKIGKNKGGQETVFFIVFLLIALTGLAIVFTPIFKTSLINPVKDALFIALVILFISIMAVFIRNVNQK